MKAPVILILLIVAILCASCSSFTPLSMKEEKKGETSAAGSREVAFDENTVSLSDDGAEASPEDSTELVPGYHRISSEEAIAMMAEYPDCLILDVRRPDEFAEGHIPGAICFPNEKIGDTAPEELPDKNRKILVYCRSGRRSAEAAEKLILLGYTDVWDFGGILSYPGKTIASDPEG